MGRSIRMTCTVRCALTRSSTTQDELKRTVERFRCGAQIHAGGKVVLRNVTVREPGYFGFDASAGNQGRVTMGNCRGDVAYSPLFNLTRGATPRNSLRRGHGPPPTRGY